MKQFPQIKLKIKSLNQENELYPDPMFNKQLKMFNLKTASSLFAALLFERS